MAVIKNLLIRLGIDVDPSGVSKGFAKVQDFATKGAALAGIGAGAALSAGLASAMDLSASRGKLQAQLGVTAKESQDIGAVAGKLFANAYGTSMDDVNVAITSVIQNMDGMKNASKASLEQTTARAMDLATVMGEDVSRVTMSVSQMMKTGLAKNSKEAFDILTRGTQMGLNKSQDLLDTFNEYGTQFRKLGIQGPQALGLLSQGLKAGARDSDIVADSLKEFSIRAIDGSKNTVAGFKAIGLNAGDMADKIAKGGGSANKALDLTLDKLRGIKDPVKQSAIAVQLFGTQAEDLGKALFALDPSKATKGIDNLAGATDRAGKAMGETSAAKFESFKRTLMTNVVSVVDTVVTKFNAMTPETQAMIIKIAGISAVALPAGIALFKIGGYAVGATKGLFGFTKGAAQLVGGLVKGTAALGENASAAAKVGAAMRNAGPNTVNFVKGLGDGIGKAAGLASSMTKVGVETAKNAAITAGAAIKQGVFTTAQVVGNVASKALAIGMRAVGVAVRFATGPIGLIITAIGLLIAIVVTAYKKNETFRKIVDAVWKGIKDAISFAWKVIQAVFKGIVTFIVGTLGPKFLWFHNNIVKPVMEKVGSTIKTVVDKAKLYFNTMVTIVTKVLPNAFKSGVAAIKSIWDKVINIAKTPVNLVIRFYNQGIGKLINKLAEFVGISARVPAISYFARGGILPGYSPGNDTMLAAVSPGESIFRPEFTRAVGTSFVNNANAVARNKGPGGVKKWLSGDNALGGEGLAFANGGTVPGFAGQFGFGGIIGSFIKGVKDFTIGNVAKGAKTLIDKIIGAGIPGSGLIQQVIRGIPTWVSKNVVNWIKGKIDSGGVGGPGIDRALSFARAQSGKPYVWGGVGPGGYDCSGFMSAIQNVIRGRHPYSRLYSTHSFGASGPDGMVRNLRSGFTVGVTDAGVGHMAGTLKGVNVESNGSQGVHLGPGARGTTNGLFTRRYGLKLDQGGLLPTGNTNVYNGTGKPEYVFTNKQMQGMQGGDTFQISITVSPGTDVRAFENAVYSAIKKYKNRNGKSLTV